LEWNDEGVLLTTRPYGENFKILQFFTKSNGLHSGLIRISKKNYGFDCQPGNHFKIRWKARLREHLGTFDLDIVTNRTTYLLLNKTILLAFNSIASLITTSLPEREQYFNLYDQTKDLIENLSNSNNWLLKYVKWELSLLNELGFGLDLSCCVLTGETKNLIYVSPKSGCAVSEKAGKNWSKKLLRLPNFLTNNNECLISKEDILLGLKLTEFFLKKKVYIENFEKKFPSSRDFFVKQI